MSDHGLSNHHSSTLNEIFDHQKHSVEWRKVKSLLDAVGTVEKEHNGHLKVTIGPETETFHVPNGKDQKDRDYGDNRRGNPSES